MAKGKSPGTDFESRYFDLLIDRLDRQDDKLETILVQTQKTNGKVIKLRSDVDDLQAKVLVVKKFAFPDSRLLYIAGVCLLVFLLIVAAVLRVDIPGGIAL